MHQHSLDFTFLYWSHICCIANSIRVLFIYLYFCSNCVRWAKIQWNCITLLTRSWQTISVHKITNESNECDFVSFPLHHFFSYISFSYLFAKYKHLFKHKTYVHKAMRLFESFVFAEIENNRRKQLMKLVPNWKACASKDKLTTS